MPFNGSGVFVPIAAPDYPATPNTLIRAAQFNNNLTDIFNGLTTCITRNGQSPAQANLPMAGFKHTGAGDATAAGQYLVYGQNHPATAIDGNLTLVGVGRRILADFSNATHANRGLLQTTSANSPTVVGIMPSGTGVTGQLNCYNTSDPNNASILQLLATSTETRIASSQNGSGTNLPLVIQVGGATRVTVSPTTGQWAFTNKLIGAASVAGEATLNIPPGVAPTSPANGDLWETSAGVFGRIDGNTTPIGSLVLIKPATTSRASTTTETNDPHLLRALGAGETYLVDLFLSHSSASATPDFKFKLNYTGTVTDTNCNAVWASNADAAVGSAPLNGAGQVANSGTPGMTRVTILIRTTTSGTLSLQWAQGVSDVNAVNLLAGSSMHLTRMI